MNEHSDDPLSGLTGDLAGVTLGDRADSALCPTPALVTCGDARCLYSMLTWQTELPAPFFQGTRRGPWPKCPDKDRVRLIEPLRDERG
jgi:hypothetical protein